MVLISVQRFSSHRNIEEDFQQVEQVAERIEELHKALQEAPQQGLQPHLQPPHHNHPHIQPVSRVAAWPTLMSSRLRVHSSILMSSSPSAPQ